MSITIASLIGNIIVQFLVWKGIQVLPDQADAIVKVLAWLITAFGVWFGRWRLGGVSILGFRR